MFFIATAAALCVDDPAPPRTTVLASRAYGDRPIAVEADWFEGAELAGQLRLRGPHGRLVRVRAHHLGAIVRLVPENGWTAGVYVVEQRGDYGPHGARLFQSDRPPDHSLWFPIASVRGLERPEDLPPLETVFEVSPGVSARLAEPTPSVRWAELELWGLGTVSARSLGPTATLDTATHGTGSCNDHPTWIPRPPSATRARVHWHGEGGATRTTPWFALPPDDGSATGWKTWKEVALSADAEPPVLSESTCAHLESVETTSVDGTVRYEPDLDGILRRLTVAPFTLEHTPIPALRGTQPDAFQATPDGWNIWLGGQRLTIHEGRVVDRQSEDVPERLPRERGLPYFLVHEEDGAYLRGADRGLPKIPGKVVGFTPDGNGVLAFRPGPSGRTGELVQYACRPEVRGVPAYWNARRSSRSPSHSR